MGTYARGETGTCVSTPGIITLCAGEALFGDGTDETWPGSGDLGDGSGDVCWPEADKSGGGIRRSAMVFCGTVLAFMPNACSYTGMGDAGW